MALKKEVQRKTKEESWVEESGVRVLLLASTHLVSCVNPVNC
jgi:hypothetical protein